MQSLTSNPLLQLTADPDSNTVDINDRDDQSDRNSDHKLSTRDEKQDKDANQIHTLLKNQLN